MLGTLATNRPSFLLVEISEKLPLKNILPSEGAVHTFNLQLPPLSPAPHSFPTPGWSQGGEGEGSSQLASTQLGEEAGSHAGGCSSPPKVAFNQNHCYFVSGSRSERAGGKSYPHNQLLTLGLQCENQAAGSQCCSLHSAPGARRRRGGGKGAEQWGKPMFTLHIWDAGERSRLGRWGKDREQDTSHCYPRESPSWSWLSLRSKRKLEGISTASRSWCLGAKEREALPCWSACFSHQFPVWEADMEQLVAAPPFPSWSMGRGRTSYPHANVLVVQTRGLQEEVGWEKRCRHSVS